MTNSYSSLLHGKRNLSTEQENHARALRFLSFSVFLLMADPLINIYVGPAPIYAIDFMTFLTWVYAIRIRPTRRYSLRGLIGFILITMFLSELLAGIQLGTLLQPVYLITRTLLAMSLYFSTSRIIQSKNDLLTLMKACLLGTLITSSLMIASSLPQTQTFVARYIFSHSFLMPSAEDVAAKYGYASIAMRGYSLVGISILSGTFLTTIWPLLFLLRADERLGAGWKAAQILAAILVPLGAVMSYSRGVIAGLVVIVVIVVLMSSGRIRGPVVLGVGIAVLIFSWVGFGSQYFKLEWLQEKTQYQLTHVYQSADMTHRIFAYTEPFRLVRAKPVFLFLGEGFARRKIGGAPSAVSDLQSHTVFGSASYGYGMLAAFAYIFLLIGVFRITWSYAWRSENAFLKLFSRTLLAGLFGLASWFILGHAAVDEPRGAMLLFFVFGLVAAQSNFVEVSEPVESESMSLRNRRSFLERRRSNSFGNGPAASPGIGWK